MEKMKEILRVKQITIETDEMPLDYVTSPYDVINWLQKEIGNETQELLVLLCLNTKNKVTHYSVVHRGTVNQSIAHPRDIFQRALLSNASRIMVSHLHPSGDTTPSDQDNVFTDRVVKCGKLLGIEVLDHIIVSEHSYYSYREENKI